MKLTHLWWRLLLYGLFTVNVCATNGNYLKCTENYCENEGKCLPMTASTSPSRHYGHLSEPTNLDETTTTFFVSNGNAQNWYAARDSCKQQKGRLIDYDSSDPLVPALAFIHSYVSSGDKVGGFWVGQEPNSDNECYVLDQFGILSVKLCSDTLNAETGGIFLGLCRQNQDYPQLKETNWPAFFYSCQCPEGYGFENCTKTSETAGSLNFGHTFCQRNPENITLFIGSEDRPLIFIDHVAYGRPLDPPGGRPNVGPCRSFEYASSVEKYCVASNSLAAITYWCQGKESCTFSPNWLVGTHQMHYDPPSILYTINQGSPVEGFLQAVESCSGSLASLTSEAKVQEALDLIASLNTSSLEGYWVGSPASKFVSHFTTIKENERQPQGACLVLVPAEATNLDAEEENHSWHLRRESCYESNWKYGVICQATFGATGEEKGQSDDTCFQELNERVLEYRYHAGAKLNRRDISCPMKVNFRRGNTCYKITDAYSSWAMARISCWRWGGELAFPLPEDHPECAARIFYAQESEQLWMASDEDCGEERCPIPFDSPLFKEGTYTTSQDVCHSLGIGRDRNETKVLRRGLCALPVAMEPRTPLPPSDSCPKLSPGDDQWPFPNYAWERPGTSGQLSIQNCPKGQVGNATWFCGLDGEWVDYPDLSNCSKIDTERVIEQLQESDSIPSRVIQDLYRNVSQEEELGAGDVRNIIDVLKVALEVQYDRLETVSEPTEYAENYTRESVVLISDILQRPNSWFGIPFDLRNQELSKLQVNLDDVAKSLISYSAESEHAFESTSLALEIRRNYLTSQADFVSDSGDSIIVSSEGDEKTSIAFYAFSNLECIVDGRFDCLETGEGEELLNTGVVGATLFDKNNEMIGPQDVLLSFQLKKSNVNITEPKCVFWDVNKSDWSTDDCELISLTPNEVKCRCTHLTNFGVIMDIGGILDDNSLLSVLLTWVTIFGCSLSIISLIVCVYVFTAIRGLRTDRTTIHRNLCLTLLIAELLLVAGLDATSNPALCGVIAGFLHYFFLAAFAWMLVEGIDVYLMLVKVFDTGRSMVVYFYLIGYAFPAGIVILSIIIAEATGRHGYGTSRHCWLDTQNGLIWAFAVPVACILVVNVVMFVIAIRIAQRSIQKRGASNEKTLALIRGSLSLLCILGITWIFGFTYFANGSEWLAFIFALLNSLQGFFIFLFHVLLNEKAKQELLRHLRNTRTEVKSYFSKSTTSSPANNASKEITSEAVSTKTFDDKERKISSNVTMSTDIKPSGSPAATERNEEEAVKYYRGQITMIVASPSSSGGNENKSK